ncbi:elongin-C-like [Toxorhynchites rutilus septentrionalis]|uniref:elongin-C-like n=1 Tax=Toxorhynchites rutilus septentrionalis TaxID=329112 RepID=UPI00247B096B|nr:elongin-C-like [Toxorhynchites rutilus septentrionalis]
MRTIGSESSNSYISNPTKQSSATAMDNCEKSKHHIGNCEGPDSEFIKLVSAEGDEFIVKREHAFLSDIIQAMLSGPGQFAESETNTIHFREISSPILEKVCQYLEYKHRYMNSSNSAPEFPIEFNMVLQLLLAANFLNI